MCQKVKKEVVKKLTKSCQKLSKVVNKLSKKSCQKVVKKLSKSRLDIFHGLQRISSTLKKGEQSRISKCDRVKFNRELRLIVRRRTDQGDKRQQTTAISSEIESNIQELIERWESKLSAATLDQLRTLRAKHSECLSCIGVGAGTMANENIHKQIIELFHGVRSVGPEVVLARLTTFFYEHNQKIRGVQTEPWHT
jgi:uncharacterized protein YukE